MRTLLVAALGAALLLPVAALAKGPSSASVSGPGLLGSVPVPGEGEGGYGTPLGDLVSAGGFFPAMFGQSPDPMSKAKPKGLLGPRYTVTYVVPGPNGKSTIVQQIYPYAKPDPVTYMKPGQAFWGDQRTYGGWFRGSAQLKAALVRIGLPASPPAEGGAGFWSTGAIAGLAAGLAAALGLAAAGFALLRRRPRPAAA